MPISDDAVSAKPLAEVFAGVYSDAISHLGDEILGWDDMSNVDRAVVLSGMVSIIDSLGALNINVEALGGEIRMRRSGWPSALATRKRWHVRCLQTGAWLQRTGSKYAWGGWEDSCSFTVRASAKKEWRWFPTISLGVDPMVEYLEVEEEIPPEPPRC